MAIVDPNMRFRRVCVPAAEAVYVRGIFEASCGVAAVYSRAGGEMVFGTWSDRVEELDALLKDLKEELGDAMFISVLESFSTT